MTTTRKNFEKPAARSFPQGLQRLEPWERDAVLPARTLVQTSAESRERLTHLGISIYEALLDRGRSAGVDPRAASNPVPQFHALVTELIMIQRSLAACPDLQGTARRLQAALQGALGRIDLPPPSTLGNRSALHIRPFIFALMLDEEPLSGLITVNSLIGRGLDAEPRQLLHRDATGTDLRWLSTVCREHIASAPKRRPHLPLPQRELCREAEALGRELEGLAAELTAT